MQDALQERHALNCATEVSMEEKHDLLRCAASEGRSA